MPYVHVDRFYELQEKVAGLDIIDGLTPSIAETAPALNNRTSVSEGRLNIVGVDSSLLDGIHPTDLGFRRHRAAGGPVRTTRRSSTTALPTLSTPPPAMS